MECILGANLLQGVRIRVLELIGKVLLLPRCSEPEFRQWWKTYSPKEYSSLYYDVAVYIWDSAEINHT